MTIRAAEWVTLVSDFFDNQSGLVRRVRLKTPTPWCLDLLGDLQLRRSRRLAALKAARGPRQRILAVGVAVPSRPGRLEAIMRTLSDTRHHLDCVTFPMKPQGKFANTDEAILAAPAPLESYDWLVITDDDVGLPPHFLDDYLALAVAADLAISQPAHRFASYVSFEVTRRKFGSLVRESNFVEIGPLTVLRKDAFADLIPFPASRWCWGIDVIWAEIAKRRGWRMGIVDGVPVRHLKPIAKSYDKGEAVAEARALLSKYDVQRSRAELLTSTDVLAA